MTNSKPDVSVIIASHNRLWALPKAVESCRHSNCRTEIIVVDDGSTDETWSWLQAQEDVVSIQTDHWGKCWAVNAGFAASTGEFIRFLDSDDWLLSGANDRQLEIARATRADVVVAGYEHHDHVSARKTEIPWVSCGDFLVDNIHGDNFYSAFLLRRSLVAKIPHREEFPHQDSMFVMELALAKPNVSIGLFSSVAYRSHARGHLRDRTGLDAAVVAWRTVAMYKKVLTLLNRRGECTELRKVALLRALWHEARRLTEWDMKEARTVIDWILDQDETFTPPVSSVVNCLYRAIGFEMTERVARVPRNVVHALKHRRRIPED